MIQFNMAYTHLTLASFADQGDKKGQTVRKSARLEALQSRKQSISKSNLFRAI